MTKSCATYIKDMLGSRPRSILTLAWRITIWVEGDLSPVKHFNEPRKGGAGRRHRRAIGRGSQPGAGQTIVWRACWRSESGFVCPYFHGVEADSGVGRNLRSWKTKRSCCTHAYRHSCASRAPASSKSLTMIGKLLGHTQVQMNARYAHLSRHSVQNAAARITESIGAIS